MPRATTARHAAGRGRCQGDEERRGRTRTPPSRHARTTGTARRPAARRPRRRRRGASGVGWGRRRAAWPGRRRGRQEAHGVPVGQRLLEPAACAERTGSGASELRKQAPGERVADDDARPERQDRLGGPRDARRAQAGRRWRRARRCRAGGACALSVAGPASGAHAIEAACPAVSSARPATGRRPARETGSGWGLTTHRRGRATRRRRRPQPRLVEEPPGPEGQHGGAREQDARSTRR